ncbi:hypothetical protein ACJ41O_015154 [Fusarium nematophilum]
MTDVSIIDTTLSSIVASDVTLTLLRDLHIQALTEDPDISDDEQRHPSAVSKFVALDPDKCALVYLLLRASGARNVVEAGTSFGLSTIYLALAVGQNIKAQNGAEGTVIATENEASKAKRARKEWKKTGPEDEIEKRIELREGDLRETLKTGLPEIDFLLLDIWTPLALPALKLVHPHLKVGALVVADNTDAAKSGYKDMMAYLNNPLNGFRNTTAPYGGGLLIAVYVGKPLLDL